MGSKSRAALNSRFPQVKRIELEGLRGFAALLGSEEKSLFNKAYGNLLRLLRLDVQENALMALSQFYDPDLRCFLFKDFQLSPTLEEYDQILGFSRSGFPPYQYQKHRYTDQSLSSMLQISVRDLEGHKVKRNRITGFPLSYFEGLLKSFAQDKKWGQFKQLLALNIFGIILFPQMENFVDEDAIGVFMAFISKDKPINPVPAVLADVFYSFTHHRVLGKKKLVCSLHVLYAWFLNHVITHKKKPADLVDYALSCEVEAKNAQEWSHVLEGLEALRVNWFTPSCWENRPSVLTQCGEFQNVPLMGTQGCINYNPFLTIRQLGYPMRSAPTEDMLNPIFVDWDDSKTQALLQKVSKAWENPVYKSKEEITKKAGEVAFYPWLHKRILDIRSPLQNALPAEAEILKLKAPTHGALTEVQSVSPKLEEERRILQDKLEKVTAQKRKLEEEIERKNEALEESCKKLKKEEESKPEMKKYLQGAKGELEKSNAKVGEAMARANIWKKLFEKSVENEKAAKKALIDCEKEFRARARELENQLRGVREDKESIERVLKEYQHVLRLEQEDSDELKRNLRHISDAYTQVREESQYWEYRFLELIGKIESQEVVRELRAEAQHWRDRFSKLAWLANQAVRDIPRRLSRAEAEMLPCNTPVQVYRFVEFCRTLTEELMEKARGAATASKEEKKEEKLKAICL